MGKKIKVAPIWQCAGRRNQQGKSRKRNKLQRLEGCTTMSFKGCIIIYINYSENLQIRIKISFARFPDYKVIYYKKCHLEMTAVYMYKIKKFFK